MQEVAFDINSEREGDFQEIERNHIACNSTNKRGQFDEEQRTTGLTRGEGERKD